MSRLTGLREKYLTESEELDPFPYSAIGGGAMRYTYGPSRCFLPREEYIQDQNRYPTIAQGLVMHPSVWYPEGWMDIAF